MIPITRTDLFVLITVAACIHIGALVLAIWAVVDGKRMVAEAQRLIRAVGALVIEEVEKTRALFSQ